MEKYYVEFTFKYSMLFSFNKIGEKNPVSRNGVFFKINNLSRFSRRMNTRLKVSEMKSKISPSIRRVVKEIPFWDGDQIRSHCCPCWDT